MAVSDRCRDKRITSSDVRLHTVGCSGHEDPHRRPRQATVRHRSISRGDEASLRCVVLLSLSSTLSEKYRRTRRATRQGRLPRWRSLRSSGHQGELTVLHLDATVMKMLHRPSLGSRPDHGLASTWPLSRKFRCARLRNVWVSLHQPAQAWLKRCQDRTATQKGLSVPVKTDLEERLRNADKVRFLRSCAHLFGGTPRYRSRLRLRRTLASRTRQRHDELFKSLCTF